MTDKIRKVCEILTETDRDTEEMLKILKGTDYMVFANRTYDGYGGGAELFVLESTEDLKA